MRYIFYIVCIVLIGCAENIDYNEEISIRVAEKTKRYTHKQLQKCKDKAAIEAENYVDSIISKWVASELVDTISIPQKPSKPVTPPAILGTVDSFPLQKE